LIFFSTFVLTSPFKATLKLNFLSSLLNKNIFFQSNLTHWLKNRTYLFSIRNSIFCRLMWNLLLSIDKSPPFSIDKTLDQLPWIILCLKNERNVDKSCLKQTLLSPFLLDRLSSLDTGNWNLYPVRHFHWWPNHCQMNTPIWGLKKLQNQLHDRRKNSNFEWQNCKMTLVLQNFQPTFFAGGHYKKKKDIKKETFFLSFHISFAATFNNQNKVILVTIHKNLK